MHFRHRQTDRQTDTDISSMQHFMHHVTVSLQQNYLTKQLYKLYLDNSAHFVLLFVTKNVEFATFTQTVMIRTVLHITGSSPNIEYKSLIWILG